MDLKQLWSLSVLSLRHLWFVIPTIRATRKTVAICNERYGKAHHKNGPENGFRHALWNMLIVKKSIEKGLTLERSLAWAKTITDWHEAFSPNEELARAMDIHNNRVGRNLIAEFPDEPVDFIIGQLLNKVPLSQLVVNVSELKRTQISNSKNDRNFLIHIEEQNDKRNS